MFRIVGWQDESFVVQLDPLIDTLGELNSRQESLLSPIGLGVELYGGENYGGVSNGPPHRLLGHSQCLTSAVPLYNVLRVADHSISLPQQLYNTQLASKQDLRSLEGIFRLCHLALNQLLGALIGILNTLNRKALFFGTLKALNCPEQPVGTPVRPGGTRSLMDHDG